MIVAAWVLESGEWSPQALRSLRTVERQTSRLQPVLQSHRGKLRTGYRSHGRQFVTCHVIMLNVTMSTKRYDVSRNFRLVCLAKKLV